VINPKRGYLVSANHRTIQSFYKLTLGTSTGSFGETDRGLRIKERIREHLVRNDKFTPEDVLIIQYDGVNVAKREIVHLGYHIRDVLKADLSPASLKALVYLEDWYKNGAQMNTSVKGTELASEMQIIFRAGRFALARVYGGGGSGLANFAKTISRRLEENTEAEATAQEIDFVDTVLRSAWNNAVSKYGSDTSEWQEKFIENMQYTRMRYFQSLERFPSLDERFDVAWPILTVTDGGTIWSQRAQAYTQYVPLDDVDAAKSITPVGSSEHPESPYRFSTYSDWRRGTLHYAPLSRRWIVPFITQRTTLSIGNDETPDFVVEDKSGNEILPGRGPTDPTIREDGVRRLIQRDCSPEEADETIQMLLEYVKSDKALTDELIGSFQRVIYLEYGTEHARQNMGEILKHLGAKLPPERPEKFKRQMRERREAARKRNANRER
jgi:hypothetical protein